MIFELYKCPSHNYRYSIFRHSQRAKKLGHKKWLYCPFCKKNTNFTRIK